VRSALPAHPPLDSKTAAAQKPADISISVDQIRPLSKPKQCQTQHKQPQTRQKQFRVCVFNLFQNPSKTDTETVSAG
jgi:hypothetical protein